MSVIINMACGLANRMFQYAFYLYLQKKGYDAYVDYFTRADLVHENVDWLRIFPEATFREATARDIRKMGGGHDCFSRLRRKLLPMTTKVLETSGAFEIILPPKNRDSYLLGAFQSAKMVESVDAEVRRIFTFPEFESGKNQYIQTRLAQENSVGLHIRKGKDYQERIWYKNTCGVEYYRKWVETDKMTVYNADGSTDVEETACGIRLRGNSTQEFPKKPFAIKLASEAKVLGMPIHKRWVLLANWMDRTMLRNAVAFEVAHQTENAFADGIGWNPHGYNVEVIMDGRHVGNYYLCEQIKIDGDRVNIQDCYEDVLEENPNPTVADCGYLLEFDDNYDEVNKFHTGRGLPCMFKDIVSDELFEAVKARIEGIEANLEAGNYDAAYNDLDIHSVIDYFFIQELAFNDEYKHPKSVYMYIDGLGKLTAGPVWDFDWQTFVNYDNVEAMINKYGCDTYRCRKGDEWLYGASKLAEKPTWPWQDYDYENDKPYMWYPLLFKDANFRQAVQERWTIIYPALLTVESKIEELADQNRLSDTFNSVMWPQIQVKSSGTTAFNGDEEMTFDEAVASMKQAYRERLNWMNTNIMNGSFVIDAE